MKGVANSLLAVILVSFFMLSFTNFLMFFPWYLTLVYKTFNIATEASTVNYVQACMVDDAITDLSSRPIFTDDVNVYMNDTLISRNTNNESLRLQRGQKFSVKTSAKFPFIVKIFGREFKREVDINFSIPATGIQYYKDLDPYSR
jgi:hypothetical protein